MPEAIVVGGAFIMPPLPTKEDKEKMAALEKARAERVDRLLKRICETTPLGKQIVESAEKRGISIGIDGDKGNAWGSYSPSMKYVSLNEKATDAQLLSTIVHELRHSEQKPEHDFNNTVFASIAEVRAMEADAMAHECAAVFQMRHAEPVTYELFVNRHGGIMKAFEESFKKDKDMTKAKAEAFKAWYDHAEYVELYDRSVVEFSAMGKMTSGAYKDDMPSSKLAEKVDYVEQSFFDSPRAATVSEETARETEKVERGHVRNMLKFFGKSKIPTSADHFWVRDGKGNVSEPKRPRAAQNAVRPRLVEAKLGKGR